MPKAVIITDLDGTLLDAATYSFDPALPALNLIQKRDILLILCSSKTRAETEEIRRRRCNHLRYQLQIKVRGFADMTAEEVAVLTGLPHHEAMLARQRDFDEPFVFEGAPDERFLRAIEAAGLSWAKGRTVACHGLSGARCRRANAGNAERRRPLPRQNPQCDRRHNQPGTGRGRKKSRQLGLATKITSAELQGETRAATCFLVQTVREMLAGLQAGERCCLLCGCETTVFISGTG